MIYRKLAKRSALMLFPMVSVCVAHAQKVSIGGIVTNLEGKVVENATVRIDGIGASVVYTDSIGHYTISANVGSQIIVERIGYSPIKFIISPTVLSYPVVLKESEGSLDEVVITASGEYIKKRSQGYLLLL